MEANTRRESHTHYYNFIGKNPNKKIPIFLLWQLKSKIASQEQTQTAVHLDGPSSLCAIIKHYTLVRKQQ